MKYLTRIFAKLIIIAMAWMIVVPNAFAATNVPMTGIGDYGDWMTQENMEEFYTMLGTDITEFAPKEQTETTENLPVPAEAKVGLALMNGMSAIANILDSSLVRFAIIFMIIAYVFWVMFEAYNMMVKGTSAMDLGVNLVKKGAVIAIWSFILMFGPAQLFMWIMGPIVSVASYLSDLILNAVTMTVGLEIPDTCGAIHAYTAANLTDGALLNVNAAADLMCLPTRLSGFFWTTISAGWQWVGAGIGHSAFTTFVGAVFIVMFVYAGFKFALMGLGVIVDLFLSVIMLPFTAIAETLNNTSYKGIVGDIFNGFLGLFQAESLSKQITRFINAAIYFVTLSVVIAVCAALLSGVVTTDLAAKVPTLENAGFIPTLLTGALVLYLATHAGKIAEDFGGKIDNSFGKQVSADISKLWKITSSKGKEMIKKIRKKD